MWRECEDLPLVVTVRGKPFLRVASEKLEEKTTPEIENKTRFVTTSKKPRILHCPRPNCPRERIEPNMFYQGVEMFVCGDHMNWAKERGAYEM